MVKVKQDQRHLGSRWDAKHSGCRGRALASTACLSSLRAPSDLTVFNCRARTRPDPSHSVTRCYNFMKREGLHQVYKHLVSD